MNIDFNNPSHVALLCFAAIAYGLLNALGNWCARDEDDEGWEGFIAALWFIHLFLLFVAGVIQLGILIYKTL